MRRRVITEEALQVLKDLKRNGASYQTLADFYGCGKKTVIDAFNGRKPPRAAAQEHPDRTTRMMPYNGGCSTVSGLVQVTLPRLRCLEAANDNVPADVRGREVQVAA